MSLTLNGSSGLSMPDSSAIASGEQVARAWVNFDGTGTVAIRDSYNVSSITDNGTGDYTVNFATALPNANYCPHVTSSGAATTVRLTVVSAVPTTTTLRICTASITPTITDIGYVFATVFAGN